MPIISAGVVTKQGKVVLARQFSDTTRIRVEGLLSAFPRLLESSVNTQVTFIDAGTVRYVYQPLEDLFLVLVTTKHSNIVEDLATLHLMGRLIPEYLPEGIRESTLEERSFEIFFALDEVVVGGKRENTTVEHIHTYLEMDSYEERMALEAKRQQMESAAKASAEQAKVLRERKRAAAMGMGGGSAGGAYGGFGSDDTGDAYNSSRAHTSRGEGYGPSNPSSTPAGGYGGMGVGTSSSVRTAGSDAAYNAAPAAPRSGMSLGKARKTDLSAKVQREVGGPAAVGAGVNAPPPQQMQMQAQAASMGADLAREGVHIVVEEKMTATLGREGDSGPADIKGELSVLVSDPKLDHIKVNLAPVSGDFQFRAHAKVNKALFASDHVLAMLEGKPFPVQQPVTILRWRLQNPGSVQPPIAFTCWPEPGSITVEYELSNPDAPPLEHVTLVIPLYTAAAMPEAVAPSVGSCEVMNHAPTGGYAVVWTIPVIDGGRNSEGNLEIRLANEGQDAPEHKFFPIEVSFQSTVSVGLVRVSEVVSTETGTAVRFSQETRLVTDNLMIQ